MSVTIRGDSAVARLRADFRGSPSSGVECPACGRFESKPLAITDRHGLGLRVGACAHCGLVRLVERPADDWFVSFYEHRYWDLYSGRDSGREAVSSMLRADEILGGIAPSLPREPTRCLDVCCGFGGMLCAFRRRFPRSEVVGTDLSHDAIHACRARHSLQARQADWNALAAGELPGPFDLITMTHVLEHNLHPVLALSKAAERLAEDGRLYVEVPDLGSPHWRGGDFFHIAHLWYFDESSLRDVLSRAGLEPVEVFRGLAEVWPWGIGILARRRGLGPAAETVPGVSAAELAETIERVRRQAGLGPDRPAVAGGGHAGAIGRRAGAFLTTARSRVLIPTVRRASRLALGQDVVGVARQVARLRREIDDLRALVRLQSDDIGRLYQAQNDPVARR